jgi:glucose-6-phosphate dehydrogenase assembly protein OpcA
VTTLWDTTGSDVVRALEAERRSAGALAFGLALTLVVVTDQNSVAEAEAAAKAAASAHPCRILMVIRRHLEAPDPRLDAEVLIGGRLGPGEAVLMRMYGRLGLHAESVVLPLLAPDAPVVTWFHEAMPEKIAYDPLGVFADRRVTESIRGTDPMVALRQRAVDYAPGDTDLSWARTTSWRALIAAAFDSLPGAPKSAVVKGSETPPTALIVGWLRSKLGIKVDLEKSGRDVEEVSFRLSANGRGTSDLLIRRRDDRTAVITREDQADRIMPLAPRDLGDLLAEDVRRLDADEVYGEALSAWTGLKNLGDRPAKREHIWHDPTKSEKPDTRASEKSGTASAERPADPKASKASKATKSAKAPAKATKPRKATSRAATKDAPTSAAKK